MPATLDFTELARVRVRSRRELPSPTDRRAIRKAAGLTLQEVGAAVGVSGQAIGMWEAGSRTPRGPHLERYVDVLRILREAAA